MSSDCKKCSRNKIEKDGLCSICWVEQFGLPWMSKMKVEHNVQTEVAYVVIDKKNYLVISGSNGMIFTQAEVKTAEDRFRGQIELDT